MVIVSINDLCLNFGGVHALSEVSLDIEEGALVSIIGPNGSGKTTLLNVLSGIYKPDRGQIILSGARIDGLRPDEITRRGITRTFQLIRLFSSMTVMENILVGGHVLVNTSLVDDFFNTSKKRLAQETLEQKALALAEEFSLIPLLEESADSLPYGTKRKVEIVRALVSNPKILLLDEPAAGMNNKESDDLKALIRAVNRRGHTIVLVEHDLQMVLSISDRVFVLNQGCKIADSLPGDIHNNEEVIKAYVGTKKIALV